MNGNPAGLIRVGPTLYARHPVEWGAAHAVAAGWRDFSPVKVREVYSKNPLPETSMENLGSMFQEDPGNCIHENRC